MYKLDVLRQKYAQTIRDRLVFVANNMNTTMSLLAIELGIQRKTLESFISGTRVPYIHTLKSIERWLDKYEEKDSNLLRKE